jgi:hypothetical protein
VFKITELDTQGEIPATYGFEKRKENLLNINNDNKLKVNMYG